MERFALDLTKISLDRFYELTRSRQMLPGRAVLHEKIDERFGLLRDAGIFNLGELIRVLGSKPKIEVFSSRWGISVNYLVLLKREAGSYLASKIPLSDFPGIPYEYVEVLKSKGIRNTMNFFEEAQTDDQQKELAGKTGIPLARLKELYALCDLSRITGVGGIFARVIYDAGIRSAKEFAATEASIQYVKYIEIIEKHAYAAGYFAEEDIRYCINYAKVITE